MMNDKNYFDNHSNENTITYENNHNHECHEHLDEEITFLDPLYIYNIKGEHIGYTWHYGDSVELVVDINKTILHVTEDKLGLLEMFISDKEFEFNFIDIRGDVKYTFYSKPEGLFVKLKLNDSEESLIEKNTYKLSLVLVNPLDFSRINLIKEYRIFVK